MRDYCRSHDQRHSAAQCMLVSCRQIPPWRGTWSSFGKQPCMLDLNCARLPRSCLPRLSIFCSFSCALDTLCASVQRASSAAISFGRAVYFSTESNSAYSSGDADHKINTFRLAGTACGFICSKAVASQPGRNTGVAATHTTRGSLSTCEKIFRFR